jgi:hypothetical protein
VSLVSQVSAGFSAVANEINTLQHPLTARTLGYSNGGIGGQNTSYVTGASTQITLTNASTRNPIRLPCTTSQWRLKLRNYDSLLSTTKTALTLDGVAMGTMAAPATGASAQTGSFDSGGAVTIVNTSATIPGDGSFYISPWVTAPGNQFQQGKDHIVSVGFHAGSSLTVQTGIGQCWFWGDNASASNASIAGSAATNPASWIPLDWVIEYQVTSRQRAFLVVGDSISEGTTGPAYAISGSATNAAPTALWRGQWDRWAARRGYIVQKLCLYASPASTWANPSYTGWSRQTTVGPYDGAVLALGANDIKGGRTFTQLQADYTSCITNLRNIVGNSVPLYGLTVMAESMTGTIDVESEMRDSATNALDAALTCDSIHPSYQGQVRLADVFAASIP